MSILVLQSSVVNDVVLSLINLKEVPLLRHFKHTNKQTEHVTCIPGFPKCVLYNMLSLYDKIKTNCIQNWMKDIEILKAFIN